jgi:hypothetical protein
VRCAAFYLKMQFLFDGWDNLHRACIASDSRFKADSKQPREQRFSCLLTHSRQASGELVDDSNLVKMRSVEKLCASTLWPDDDDDESCVMQMILTLLDFDFYEFLSNAVTKVFAMPATALRAFRFGRSPFRTCAIRVKKMLMRMRSFYSSQMIYRTERPLYDCFLLEMQTTGRISLPCC